MKLVKTDNSSSDFGWISRGIEISGDIVFNDRLNVDGKVVGRLKSDKGTLIIGEAGLLEAQVEVGECIIHGTLRGDLIATGRVEIHRTGKVYGDLITPALLVEEGAMFNGAIKMGHESASPRMTEVVSVEDADARRHIKGA